MYNRSELLQTHSVSSMFFSELFLTIPTCSVLLSVRSWINYVPGCKLPLWHCCQLLVYIVSIRVDSALRRVCPLRDPAFYVMEHG